MKPISISQEKDFRIGVLNPIHRIDPPKNKVVISIQGGIEVFELTDIVRCQAESNYCNIITRNGRAILTSKTLKVVEAALGDGSFIRIHNSHLVNIDDIKKVGYDFVTMSCGKDIPVSRAKRKIVIDRICEISNVI